MTSLSKLNVADGSGPHLSGDATPPMPAPVPLGKSRLLAGKRSGAAGSDSNIGLVRPRDFRQLGGFLHILVGGDLPPEPIRRYWFDLNGGYLSWFRDERSVASISSVSGQAE